MVQSISSGPVEVVWLFLIFQICVLSDYLYDVLLLKKHLF